MSDPILHADRACKDMPLDVFFPPSRQIRRVQQAQVICAGCPVRRRCAEWAAPLVEVQDLIDCVIAGVQVPIYHTSAKYQARRKAAVAELQDIAAGRDAVEAGTEAA
ncbi:WhiB family transcriptional regulator [Nocardia rhamnosiphila]|uniref:WhiB family transcriptional regulator n=1 Tax=Nocardia rhamnosiphila TaxID=426716 RepID=A0ABV2X0V8_9NOCA